MVPLRWFTGGICANGRSESSARDKAPVPLEAVGRGRIADSSDRSLQPAERMIGSKRGENRQDVADLELVGGNGKRQRQLVVITVDRIGRNIQRRQLVMQLGESCLG